MNLPEGFKKRMTELLGEESDAFFASYDLPRRRGLRVNTAKISAEAFVKIAPFELERVPWAENGFYYAEDDRPSRHPFYAAGLYYLQEPSAMAPAAHLPLSPGDRVLDLCAAPGGKATELASRLWNLDRAVTHGDLNAAGGDHGNEEGKNPKNRGLLVANEIHPARAKALLHNLELNGTDNYCVLNESQERMAEAFPLYFDKILVDAPCSGEGMFRKEEAALTLWSEERIRECATRQKNILEAAYAMLRPGGMLLYSTCTFAPEENEEQIRTLLHNHVDMHVEELPFARLWPHRVEGEGHFLTLLKKEDASDGPEKSRADSGVSPDRGTKRGMKRATGKTDMAIPTKEQKTLLRQFLSAIVVHTATAERWTDQVRVWQERAFLPVIEPECTRGLHVLRNGLYLGEWKKNRFEPSQSLAMVLSEDQVGRTLSFSAEEPASRTISSSAEEQSGETLSRPVDGGQLAAYLRGEAIRIDDVEDGWILLLADGFPVGWGKASRGTIKNHYPPGWRKQE